MAQVKDTLHRNLHLDHPDEGPANGWTMAAIVAVGLGVWIVLLLASSRLEDFLGGEAKAAERAGLMGAMFGQTAAVWIYDRLYPRPAAMQSSAGLTPTLPGFAPTQASQRDDSFVVSSAPSSSERQS